MRVPEIAGLKKLAALCLKNQEKLICRMLLITLRKRLKLPEQCRFVVQTRGEGEIIYKQTPQGSTEVYSGATVILELQPHDTGAVEEITVQT